MNGVSKSVEDMLTLTATANEVINLGFPQTFAITRPAGTLSTTYASYFITGTSDPSQPVYFGNAEIERLGTKGLFGVLVSLEMGTNTFTFSQGGSSSTVTITRTGETVPKISGITSMYPTYYGSANAGEALLVECTAPAGATVTATFGGSTTTLSPVVQSAYTGAAITYRGSLIVGTNYTAGQTTNAGKITYTLTYNGATTDYPSDGNVYIAGAGSRIAVQVNGYLGAVYEDYNNLGVFRELYKKGTIDYIESQNNEYYKLSSGGYLPTSQGDIIEGTVAINNQISDVSASFHNKNETYTFQGTATPAFYTKTSDNTFSITFYNSSGTPSVNYSASRLFSNVSVSESGGKVTYTFTQKASGNLWGYNVSFDGNNTVLRVAYKPSLSGGARPLSGITIVLDPGHGAADSGASGVPGKTGPAENAINLAHAQIVKDLLEQQGANVLMTRTSTNGFLELNERLEFFENSGADMFVSLHHNSLLENVDANKPSGVEIYYHTPSSKNLANYMLNAVASGTGRANRFVRQDYFRVTILPYAPSILCELGYLTNPLEYERITTQSEIDKTAQAIVNGIVQSLS